MNLCTVTPQSLQRISYSALLRRRSRAVLFSAIRFAFLLSALILASWHPIASADTTWVSGQVGGVWDVEGSPYMVVDSAWVDSDGGLSVMPGVGIVIATVLTLQGNCKFMGTETDSIYIDLASGSTPRLMTPWYPIRKVRMRYVSLRGSSRVNLTSDSTLIDNSHFDQSESEEYTPFSIPWDYGYNRLQHSVFTAIHFDGYADIQECQVERVIYSGEGSANIEGLNRMSEWRPVVSLSRFLNNRPIHVKDANIEAIGVDVAYTRSSPVVLENVNVDGWFSMDERFAGEIRYADSLRITNCRIGGNLNFYRVSGEILRSVILGQIGFGYNDVESNINFTNNTFIRPLNYYIQHILGYSYFITFEEPGVIIRLRNNIFCSDDPYLNVINRFSGPLTVLPSYNLTCGMYDPWFGQTAGPGNIITDPLFDPNSEAYDLQYSSPAIDAGDAALSDSDGTRSDIGAAWWDHRYDHPPIISTARYTEKRWGDQVRLIISASDEGRVLLRMPDRMPPWMAGNRILDETASGLIFEGRIPFGVRSVDFPVTAVDELGQEDHEILHLEILPRSDLADTTVGTLYAEYSPYYTDHNVIVPRGDSLIVEPGVHIEFDSVSAPVALGVFGLLRANGTPADSIVFSSRSNTQWEGIHASDSASFLDINYSIITNALYSIAMDSSGKSTLSHCTFNAFVPLCYGVTIFRTHDSIHVNGCQFPDGLQIGAAECSYLSLRNCLFRADAAMSGMRIEVSHGYIIENIFENYWVEIRSQTYDSVNVILERNLFRSEGQLEPRKQWISCYAHPQIPLGVKVWNNTLISNHGTHVFAGSFWSNIENANLDISNNIFVGTSDTSIAIQQTDDTSWVHLSHNCFYGNAINVAVNHEPWECVGHLIDTNINDDSVDTFGDIFLNPLFSDSIAWQLTAESPCIDAGVDLGMPYVGLAPDIGYWEYGWPDAADRPRDAGSTNQPAMIRIFPNPANAAFVIAFDEWHEPAAQIKIYNLLGQTVMERMMAVPAGGLVNLCVEGLASGKYLISVGGSGQRRVIPVTLLR